MAANRRVLIVTDGEAATVKMAKSVAASFAGDRVSITTGERFDGRDLLAADVFLLGAASPRPPCFAYLEELLRHVNLAARRAGVFSPGGAEARLVEAYLREIIAPCGARPLPE